jgi:LuxR family transcriptional regulator, maltose regulon positive regulatory protein
MFLIDSSHDISALRTELVIDKISAPAINPLVPRKRLLSVLEKSLSCCAATVICGRAGTGKTSLAYQISLTSGRLVSWYKVDAPECDPKIFFSYLVASVRAHQPGFGQGTLDSMLESMRPDGMPLLAEAFAFELAEAFSDPLLIVIDDLHLVCDAEWLVPFFRRLLPLLPAEVHVVITSRTMPPAPLWRMRSKQTLSVIDEEALTFTRSEAQQLFEIHALSNQQASIALDHTHGRAGALAAFAESLTSNGTAA